MLEKTQRVQTIYKGQDTLGKNVRKRPRMFRQLTRTIKLEHNLKIGLFGGIIYY